jgi:hypothetical protein
MNVRKRSLSSSSSSSFAIEPFNLIDDLPEEARARLEEEEEDADGFQNGAEEEEEEAPTTPNVGALAKLASGSCAATSDPDGMGGVAPPPPATRPSSAAE